MGRRKIKIRKRILAAFTAVLFVSSALTGAIFNIAIRVTAIYQGQSLAETGMNPGRSGIILVVLISVMFVISVIASYFLSNSITRPIETLGEFAQGIGQGEFTPNDFDFNELELENLNTALNNSVKKLAVYDSEQKAFFQNVSHELRTPLMSIKCYAEGISIGLMEPKKASETILQETDKLSELVADLLYISQIDNIASTFSCSEWDVLEIIRGSAERQQALAEKRHICFSFNFAESTVFCECSAELLSRAVDNLISNAIRYASSEIVISCSRKESAIEINVTDDGCGVEPKRLPHIFERFFKGPGGNHGIGLSIVKSIVEQHQGSITATNTERGGASFTISLPLTKALWQMAR